MVPLTHDSLQSASWSDCSLNRDVPVSADVHVRMLRDWAWFVSERTVMIWKHCSTNNSPQIPSSFSYFELKLPPTGLMHRADLVDLFIQDRDGAVPACLAVSPEGKVIFWPSIAAGHLSVELHLELSVRTRFSDLRGFSIQIILSSLGSLPFSPGLGPRMRRTSSVARHGRSDDDFR